MTSRAKHSPATLFRATHAVWFSIAVTLSTTAMPASADQSPAQAKKPPTLRMQSAQTDWQPPATASDPPAPSPEPRGRPTPAVPGMHHRQTTAGSATSKAPQGAQMPPTAPSIATERHADLAELEVLMFGHSAPAVPVDVRLNNLENAVFKVTYPKLPVPERITQLARTLTGGAIPGIDAAPPSAVPNDPSDLRMPRPVVQPEVADTETPFWQELLSPEHLNKFALEYVNRRRNEQGLLPLQEDPLAHKLGKELVADLTERNTVSHANKNNENPDVRYTKSGGNDAVLESVVSVRTSGRLKQNRALIKQLFDILEQRQDDRQALFSPDATHFGFVIGQTPEFDRLIGVAEVITKRGEFAPVPTEVTVGEKIEVKGTIDAPYQFDKISIAWEGGLPGGEPFDDSDEALPYFAPLDYEAHGQKAERHWEGRIRVMQMLGIAAIAAGSVFMPPVALAAPLLMAAPAMAGGGGKPKAISDIPVHGGVKVDGSGSFSHKVTVSKDGKEGIYYVTVWATTGDGATPVAISRRAVIARGGTTDQPASEGNEESNKDGAKEAAKAAKKAKKAAKKEKEAAEDAPAPPPIAETSTGQPEASSQSTPTEVNSDLDQGNNPQN